MKPFNNPLGAMGKRTRLPVEPTTESEKTRASEYACSWHP